MVGVGVGVGVGTIVGVGVDDGEAAVGEGEAPTIDVVVAVVVVVALAVAFAETLGLGFVVKVQPATAPTARTSAIITTTFLSRASPCSVSLKNQKRKATMIRFKGSFWSHLGCAQKETRSYVRGDVCSLALFAAFQAARTLLKILSSVTKHSPRSTIATAAPPTGPSTANIAAMISTATTSSQKPANKNSPRNSPWTKDPLILSPRPQMPPLRRYNVALGFPSSAHVTVTASC